MGGPTHQRSASAMTGSWKDSTSGSPGVSTQWVPGGGFSSRTWATAIQRVTTSTNRSGSSKKRMVSAVLEPVGGDSRQCADEGSPGCKAPRSRRSRSRARMGAVSSDAPTVMSQCGREAAHEVLQERQLDHGIGEERASEAGVKKSHRRLGLRGLPATTRWRGVRAILPSRRACCRPTHPARRMPWRSPRARPCRHSVACPRR